MAVVAALLDEPAPWAWQLKKNRYTPQDEGVRRHADGVLGELAPAFTRQSMAVFLDDSDGNSGALTYVPGSHERHFDRKDAPSPPTQADIYAGSYVPAVLRAGIVVLRVPEVWHAVRPIHRLRRYVTGSYMIRGDLRTEMTKRVVAERERRPTLSAGTKSPSLSPYSKSRPAATKSPSLSKSSQNTHSSWSAFWSRHSWLRGAMLLPPEPPSELLFGAEVQPADQIQPRPDDSERGRSKWISQL
jgi:hypothetical protein